MFPDVRLASSTFIPDVVKRAVLAREETAAASRLGRVLANLRENRQSSGISKIWCRWLRDSMLWRRIRLLDKRNEARPTTHRV
jgi:hypothetical protein